DLYTSDTNSFPTRRSSDLRRHQHLTWEVDLLDEVGVADEGTHGPVHAVGQEVPREHAAQEEEGEVVEAAGVADGRLHLEEEAERSEEHTSELQSPDQLVCR